MNGYDISYKVTPIKKEDIINLLHILKAALRINGEYLDSYLISCLICAYELLEKKLQKLLRRRAEPGIIIGEVLYI